ncbi:MULTISPECIES: exopolysaccharide biosynthesis protein [unclassified Coleofasciculus]|uniref:exopolysaccharide biosynthesis protein n=1 Tax=unclassified Coleofasciculus TaxID=2692782 RepID=UPI0018824B1C|nr:MULTISPECIES: exopolysaccharide biosynthesis protein [unclassified Coleofasciculus]MBE9127498.1 exopolysaccharide biosynthesis protein [Coleofasciculus sp. LEGE 07081]MBE9150840.1 exopolysaccharide biosynthesis protein [Coleofasciculus sp. LEGE 07092]
MARLSVELQRYFLEEERPPQVKLGDILALAGERIFGFLFVILSLPSALPVPAPGYSIPFGIVMLILAVQLIWGAKRPWLPERMMNNTMKLETVQGVVKGGIPWLRRIEAIARPRLPYICTSLPGRVAIGIAISLMSISMMIPIPGTNTLPAIGIWVTGFGLMEDDGAISLGGLVLCVMGGILSISILLAVWFGGTSLLDWIKDTLR